MPTPSKPYDPIERLRKHKEDKERLRRSRAILRSTREFAREYIANEKKQKANEEAGRVAPDQKLAWIYARASHVSNSDTDSVPAQIERCKRRFYANWEDRGYMLANIQPDLVTSASKIAFFDRTNGGVINRLAQAGDVILVDKMDRIFRSLSDFVMTQKDFDARGIIIEIGDCQFCSDPNNPFYRCMMVMMAMFAEMESRVKSIKVKEAFARRSDAGADYTIPPIGVHLVRRARKGFGEKPLCFREWQRWERSIMNAVCEKALKEGWTRTEVTEWLNLVVLKDCKIPHRTPWLKYPLTEEVVGRMLWQEMMYRFYKISDVKQTRHWDYHMGKLSKYWHKLQEIGWIPLPE